MPWTPVRTWGIEKWVAADANTYVRDNMKSYRNIAVGQKMFTDGPGTLTSGTYTAFATHLNLCPVAPDEQTQMIVWCNVVMAVLNSGSTTGWNTRIKDQGGTTISSNSYGLSTYTSHTRIGFGTVASGTNPGFTIESQILGTTPNFTVYHQSVAWILSTVGP